MPSDSVFAKFKAYFSLVEAFSKSRMFMFTYEPVTKNGICL